MPLFDLASIDAATNRFSQENLIGVGGFGPVYKVRLTTSCHTMVRKVSESFCILKNKSCIFCLSNLQGILPTGKEIAVKRLSKNSGQGAEEFRNEVVLIAKLQHRNLVGLYGSCIQGEERLLVYEYMPNKSLDYFIFGLVS